MASPNARESWRIDYHAPWGFTNPLKGIRHVLSLLTLMACHFYILMVFTTSLALGQTLSIPKSIDALEGHPYEFSIRRGEGLKLSYSPYLGIADRFQSVVLQEIEYLEEANFGFSTIDVVAFTGLWSGKIYAPLSGTYQFFVEANGRLNLEIMGHRYLGIEEDMPNKPQSFTVKLNGGQLYDLLIIHEKSKGQAKINLEWQYPGYPRNRIQAQYLFARVYIPPQDDLPLVVRKGAVDRYRLFKLDQEAEAAKKAVAAAKAIPPAVIQLAEKRMNPIKKEEKVIAKAEVVATSILPSPKTDFSQSLNKGQVSILDKVVFRQSDFQLLPSSYPMLNDLATTLIEHPGVAIEISGHTDNVGKASANQLLSERRAKVVAAYLTQKGVSPDQLTVVGMGSQLPLATNDTPEGRKKNRRVAFKVL